MQAPQKHGLCGVGLRHLYQVGRSHAQRPHLDTGKGKGSPGTMSVCFLQVGIPNASEVALVRNLGNAVQVSLG